MSHWLQSPELKSGIEKFEYSLKGPLVAASAVFSFDRQNSSLSGELTASIPFRKKWRHTIDATLNPDESRAFEKYTETDNNSGKSHVWELNSRGLVRNEELILDASEVAKLEAPILTAPQVIAALGQAQGQESEAYFVASRYLYVIRFEKVAGSADLTAKFTGAINPKWPSATQFDVIWNKEKSLPNSFRVKAIPVLGTLEASLTRHEAL